MICLNLPPSLRIHYDNRYVPGLIPGAREPALDEINNFMSPLVQDFYASWKHGTWYTKTASYPNGRRCRSALVPLVADLPGARRIAGTAISMRVLCPLLCKNNKDFRSIDHTTWTRRTYQEFKDAAFAWRAAQSKQERAKLFQQNGIRWCELLLLPYWDPTRFVVVDPMHNLFLGLVQTHFRELLEMDIQGSDGPEEVGPVNPQMMAKARKVWEETPTKNKLSSFSIPVLHALCSELKMHPPTFSGTSRRKAPYIAVLLVGQVFSIINLSNMLSQGEASADQGKDENNTSPTETVTKVTLGKKEIREIQKHISKTMRPSWQAPLPANFGMAGQGKLKADEWRTAIEFDLVVSVMQLLYKRGERGKRLAESTMVLAIAIGKGTSHQMTAEHEDEYTRNMTAYLGSVLKLFPEKRLKPNHHAALHLGEFLLRFGPTHGWWMFPFERLHGMLQQVNTNNKMGKLTRFCELVHSLLTQSQGSLN